MWSLSANWLYSLRFTLDCTKCTTLKRWQEPADAIVQTDQRIVFFGAHQPQSESKVTFDLDPADKIKLKNNWSQTQWEVHDKEVQVRSFVANIPYHSYRHTCWGAPLWSWWPWWWWWMACLEKERSVVCKYFYAGKRTSRGNVEYKYLNCRLNPTKILEKHRLHLLAIDPYQLYHEGHLFILTMT